MKSIVNLISEEDCYEILCKALNLTNKNEIKNSLQFDIEVGSKNMFGFLGEYFLLTTNFKKDNEENQCLTFFIKGRPSEAFQSMGVFEKESAYYDSIVKELDKYSLYQWHPYCYKIRNDIIVLENMQDKGYRPKSGNKLLDWDHIKVALEACAHMHASSFNFELKTNIKIAETYKDSVMEVVLNSPDSWFYCSILAIPFIAKIQPNLQNDKIQNFIKTKLEKKIEQGINYMKNMDKYHQVVCHRDPWGSNILFKYDELNLTTPKSAIFVDFQNVNYSPPCVDVFLILYMNTKRKFRDEILNDALKYYHNCLTEILKEMNIDHEINFNWNEFLQSFNDYKLSGLIMNFGYARVVNAPPEVIIELKQNPELFRKATYNYDETFILDMFKNYDYYKEMHFEIIEELIEYAMQQEL